MRISGSFAGKVVHAHQPAGHEQSTLSASTDTHLLHNGSTCSGGQQLRRLSQATYVQRQCGHFLSCVRVIVCACTCTLHTCVRECVRIFWFV